MASNILPQLREIFPNKSEETIQHILNIVNENLLDAPEYIFESAVNLLSETGGEPNEQHDIVVNQPNEDDTSKAEQLPIFYDHLTQIFPDCCTTHLRALVEQNENLTFDELCDHLFSSSYPKKYLDPLDILEQLREMLPNADPSYLEQQARDLVHKPEEELKRFIENAIEKDDYPTMQDYRRVQKEVQEIRQYTDRFNLKNYLQIIPNPIDYFSDPNRKSVLMSDDAEVDEVLASDRAYALNFLCNHYRFHRIKDITKLYRLNNYDLLKIASRLDRLPKHFKTQRRIEVTDEECKNIALLQEIAYIQHKKEIKAFLKWKDENYRKARQEAERHGLLQTCQCCYYNNLIPEECYFCKKGCIFCKECIKLGAETDIGNGRLQFSCLAKCDSEFSIPTLQMVLDSVVFSRMAQRKQFEEVKDAKIKGLETCPFCDFSTIPAADDKIFKCLNEDCMKETCRQCQHTAHIPLRCNEIEYDEDVKMRTYIENKMTEALLRRCWNCNKVFIKESGCNKMTCSCGALMCYVCGQKVSNYSHFGSGSRCPLFTENLNRFHADAVLKGAAQAKDELGVNVNPAVLKNDPAKDIQQHYN